MRGARPRALVLAVVLGILLGSGVAAAEKVKTNQSTQLYARPGEQAKVLLTVKSGQNMTLLAQDGRWLKVRVQGRTGYVPRSKVDMDDDGTVARNTRRRPFVDGRGKRRGFGASAPDDRVGADALGEGVDDEDDEDDPPRKTAAKPAAKPTAKPTAKPAKGRPVDEDEEDDEDDEPPPRKTAQKPAPKPVPKTVAKATIKPAPSKASDEDDEDDEDEDEGDSRSARKPSSDDDDDEDSEDPIAGRAKARPTARVSKKVSVYIEPDAESDEEFVARPTDILYPQEQEDGWTYVENAEGDAGWIQTDLLVLESDGGPARGRSIEVRLRTGVIVLQQGMRTAGSNVLQPPDNYNVGTRSIAMSLGAGLLRPMGAKYLIGGELAYDYAKAIPGISFDPDGMGPMPPTTVGVSLHNVNARLLAGLDLKKQSGMMILGRLGYRYQGFLIADVADFSKNMARIPSEVVKAPTLGAGLSIPRLTNKIGLRFALDAILFGASVNQTVGLEDGATPSVTAIVLGAGVSYRFMAGLDLVAAYDLSYMGIDFGAPLMSSMRNHMGTRVTRTDIFHGVTFGIAKPF
jgi:SH3-like domain-containing protein